MSYKIIKAHKLSELEELVNTAMTHGYVPTGGVTYVVAHGETIGRYIQAVFTTEARHKDNLPKKPLMNLIAAK